MKDHQAPRDLHRNSFLPELYAVPDRDTPTGGFEVEERKRNQHANDQQIQILETNPGYTYHYVY
jgi:hypothetical protein